MFYTYILKAKCSSHNFVFPTKVMAENFEQYLKSGSGRAFSKRHFNFKLDKFLEKATKQ